MGPRATLIADGSLRKEHFHSLKTDFKNKAAVPALLCLLPCHLSEAGLAVHALGCAVSVYRCPLSLGSPLLAQTRTSACG